MLMLLKWLDENILFILASFLLVFIPLYPKLPLLEVLPGYIVRVRLEDIFVSITFLVFLVWLLRGKIHLSYNPLLKPILAYLTVGFLSMISAVMVIQTVPLESLHINKMILHFIRRVEYFSLFFIFYSSVRSLRQVKIFLGIVLVAVVGVIIYGFGQKYLYWPAFSTMNREFAKGWMLYLTKHARVLSTFGGHYDLAAFIMMVLILLWSLFFTVKRWFWKLSIFAIIASAFWILILTASRTSFIGYIFGVTLMFFFWAYRQGIHWSFPRWLMVVTLSMVVMLSFGDLSERFTKLLRINERIFGLKSALLSPIGSPPGERAVFLENNADALAQITSRTDQPPTATRPSDVYYDIPLMIQAPGSATATAAARTYSKTAFLFDLSTAIRFDALWPMAIKGFLRNPLLGSGYSTLNKTQPTQFTEAESTDNDYLRALGETGILGFTIFFGTLLFAMYFIWRSIPIINDPLLFSLVVGFAGLLFGLLVNAVYIDVFESSKVAFWFWGVTGFVLGNVELTRRNWKKSIPAPRIPDFAKFRETVIRKIAYFLRSDLFLLLIILILAFILRLYKINTPLADWHSWRQADTSSVTRNYVKGRINILYPTFGDLSNVASGKDNPRGLRFVEFPLYNVAAVVVDKIFVGFNIEFSGRLTTIFAALSSIVFLFLIVRKYLGRKEAFLASLFYAVLPFNVFFTRVILPEPFMVATSLGMLYFFDKALEEAAKIKSQSSRGKIIIYFILASILTASSVLVKPFAIFLFLPMFYLWVKSLGISAKSIGGFCLYILLSLLPFIWWRYWISHFPEGVPAYLWLFNGDGIRFKGAFFYWLFADRLGRLILGYWGLSLLLLGVIAPPRKEGLFFYWWGVSMLAYVSAVATGNVRHDYYQILTIPIIVIFLAKGATFFIELAKKATSWFITYSLFFIVLLFTLMFGWYHIRDFYNINHPEIVEAGRAVERLTKSNTLVVAPYNGDTAFLYQTNRTGWPVVQDSIEQLIEKGAQYFVSVNFDDLTNRLIYDATTVEEDKRKYKLIEKTDKYVIIQLVPDSWLPR